MASYTALVLLLSVLKIVSSTNVEYCLDDIFADPDSCDHFYKCDNGKPVLFFCGSSELYYDTVKKVCDWYYNVKCDPRTGQRPNTGYSYQPQATGDDNQGQGYAYLDQDQYTKYDESQTQYDGSQTQPDDASLFYPVQTVDSQDPNVAPNLKKPPPGTDFSERTRRTVDDQLSAANNPYEHEIRRELSN